MLTYGLKRFIARVAWEYRKKIVRIVEDRSIYSGKSHWNGTPDGIRWGWEDHMNESGPAHRLPTLGITSPPHLEEYILGLLKLDKRIEIDTNNCKYNGG